MRSRNSENLPSSPNWKAISLGFPIFMKRVCWGIGNGHGVRAWLDNWINGDSLRGMIEGPLRQGDQGLTVVDLCHGHEWRWDLLYFELSNSIKKTRLKLFQFSCLEIGLILSCGSTPKMEISP